MSRLRRYAFSLASAYLLMGVNLIYTLASVPLALAYLTDAQFGLWALTAQISMYIALIDAGITGSVARILVDYKDTPTSPAYGSVIQTATVVNIVQAGIILAICLPLAPWLGTVMGVPEGLHHSLTELITWQSVSLVVTFVCRTVYLILGAHQRLDLVNYVQTIAFPVSFAGMWAGFHWGCGVMSIVWGQIASQVCMGAGYLWFCWRLRLLPRPGAWGRVSWTAFKELFAFARDMFLYNLGAHLIIASQTILVTRVLGLEQAAVWSVCTRAFTLASQIVLRIFESSCPSLAEMIARGEIARLSRRFRSLSVLIGSMCVLCGIGYAACNGLFVYVWTKGRFEWPVTNDVLLAVWLLFITLSRSHAGLIGLTKNFGFLRYLNFVHGGLFIGLTLSLARFGGITAMLVICLVTTILFSYAYTSWRIGRYFQLPWQQVAWDWLRRPLLLGLWLAPAGLGAAWMGAHFRSLPTFIAITGLLGTLSLWLLVRVGLDAELQAEVARRIPARCRGLLFGSPSAHPDLSAARK